MVGLMATSSKRTYTIMLHLPRFLLLVTLTPSQATVDPGFRQRLQTLTGESGSVFWGVSALVPGCWCTQGFVCALQEFLVGKKGLNDPDNHDDVVTR